MKVRLNSGQRIVTLPAWICDALDVQVGDNFSFHLKQNNKNMIVLIREKLE